MTLTTLAIAVSILCLWPLVLYVLGLLKDPFHPCLFVGVLAFFIAPYRPLVNLDPALAYVEPGSIAYYLAVTGVSMLGFYAGYGLYVRRRARRGPPLQTRQPVQFSPNRLFACGAIFVVVGVTAYAFLGYDYTATGYLRDLIILWMSGFVLVLQSVILDRRLMLPGIIVMAVALYPPLDRFSSYGQRGDTFRLACLAIPAFLLLHKRPPRAVFIPAAIALALVLSVLERTRGMVESGEQPNRVEAVLHVLPDFFENKPIHYYGTEEFIYGSAMIDTVRDEGNYNYGRFLADLAVRFLPKEFFDKDALYSPWSRTKNFLTTQEHAGFVLYPGSMPSGFAAMFVEFWWLSPCFWMLMGYWLARRYDRALSYQIDQQAYYAVMFVVVLYLITQDQYDWLLNLVYLTVPAWLAYRWGRMSTEANEEMEQLELVPSELLNA